MIIIQLRFVENFNMTDCDVMSSVKKSNKALNTLNTHFKHKHPEIKRQYFMGADGTYSGDMRSCFCALKGNRKTTRWKMSQKVNLPVSSDCRSSYLHLVLY